MNILKLVAASSVLMAGLLAGCSSDDGSDSYSNQTSSTPDEPGSAAYNASGNYIGESSVGPVMTTPDGATVYTYDEDQPGVSNCYGECAQHWPPVTAAADAAPFGNMTVITRTDGQRQWAYGGMPLYTYVDDTAAGDVTGDNEGGVWHVVRER